jgi:hypothetical protein
VKPAQQGCAEEALSDGSTQKEGPVAPPSFEMFRHCPEVNQRGKQRQAATEHRISMWRSVLFAPTANGLVQPVLKATSCPATFRRVLFP